MYFILQHRIKFYWAPPTNSAPKQLQPCQLENISYARVFVEVVLFRVTVSICENCCSSVDFDLHRNNKNTRKIIAYKCAFHDMTVLSYFERIKFFGDTKHSIAAETTKKKYFKNF